MNIYEGEKGSALDFVFSHIISILFLSGAGIPVNKRYLGNIFTLQDIDIGPLIALYPKAIPVMDDTMRWKTLSNSSPCVTTTAYSLQVLSKTIGIISKRPFGKDKPDTYLLNDIKELAHLQLSYCVEEAHSHEFPAYTIACILEGCIDLLQSDRYDKDIEKCAAWLYNKLISKYHPDSYNILELSAISQALVLYNKAMGKTGRDELITKIMLEIMSRRTRYGLLRKNPFIASTAPISHHFMAIHNLLLSYPYVQLDTLYEDAFSLFNKLYDISFNSSANYFTFSRSWPIRYTGFDIGTILRGLNSIAQWTDGEDQQRKLVDILNDSYLNFILDAFFNNFSEEYNQSLLFCKKAIQPNNENISEINFEKYIPPVFPSYIEINYPGPIINWPKNRIINLSQPLFLCSAILDVKLPDYNNYLFDLIINLLSSSLK